MQINEKQLNGLKASALLIIKNKKYKTKYGKMKEIGYLKKK